MSMDKEIWKMAFLLILFLCMTDSKEIHVSQNGEDSESCLSGTSPCESLSYVSKHIENDTTILLDSSIILNDTAVFKSVHNVTIVSRGPVINELMCDCLENNAGVVFESTSAIKLSNITIKGCSVFRNFSANGGYYRAGVMIMKCNNVVIEQVNIINSIGSGMVLKNSVGDIEISNSMFSNNSLPFNLSVDSPSNDIVRGGSGLLILVASCDDLIETTCHDLITKTRYIITNSSYTLNQLNLTDLKDSLWPLSYGGGLGIILQWGAVGNMFVIENTSFTNNQASVGGGFVYHCRGKCYNNILEINNCLFNKNTESTYAFGGAGAALGASPVYPHAVPHGNNFSIQNSMFSENDGFYGAGVLIYAATQDENDTFAENIMQFKNCTWKSNRGPVSPAVEAEPDFLGQMGAIFVLKPVFEDCQFIDNHVVPRDSLLPQFPYTFYRQVGVFLITKLTVFFKGTTVFKGNSGTALYISAGMAIFMNEATTLFQENSGEKGGAVALVGFSNIRFWNNTEFRFIDNHASFIGGAIYVLSIDQHLFLTSHTCFIEYADPAVPIQDINVSFIFEGNVADSGLADSMFITAVNPCRFACLKYNIEIPSPKETFGNGSCIAKFYYADPSRNHIASEGTVFNVSDTPPLQIIPGLKYKLPLKILDDFGEDVTRITVSQSNTTTQNISIDSAYDFIANNSIELFGYSKEVGNLTLSALGFHGTSVNLPVTLSACPPGFVIRNSDETVSCTCSASQHLYNGIVSCEQTALITPGYWVGYIAEGEVNETNLYTADCPAGLCQYNGQVSGNDRYYHLISNASKEHLEEFVCVSHRYGTLCGECEDGYSVYFHSPTEFCGKSDLCSFGPLLYVLSELLPITVLFIVILWFGISLTTGLAYSIVFMVQILQAMIISVNGSVRFDPKFLQDIRIIIYNSLNLDFFDIDELSFCLWSGAGTLDMITMKYVSVVFAMSLVLLFVIVVNNCSYRLTGKYCPRRSSTSHTAVQGLTSFLVICYFQCARTTFLILNRETPQGIRGKSYDNVVFWNGNIKYFTSRHLMYAIPALVCLLIITIPLPLLLVLDQLIIKLESKISLRSQFIFKYQPWTVFHNKMKPLLDSFQGCFRDEYRYFAGLFFVYRIIVLILLVGASTAVQYFFLLETFLVIVLTIQALIQPFRRKIHNILAVLVFCNMAIINALTVRIYTVISTMGYTSEAIFLQWIQLILIYVPLLSVFVWMMYRIYRYCHDKPGVSNEIYDDDYLAFNEDFPEELFQRSQEKTKNLLTGKSENSYTRDSST